MSNERNEKERNLKSVVTNEPKTEQKSERKNETKPDFKAPNAFEPRENTAIKPGLMVHAKGGGEMNGATGKHVGTVDRLEGDDYIKLTKADSTDKQHRWIPTSWVSKTDNKAIYLNKTEAEFNATASKSQPEEMLNKAV